MKKHSLAIALASLLLSGSAFAVTIPAGGAISTTDCDTIGEPVTLNLSSGVTGVYSCNETANGAAVATCHTSGSRKATVFQCVSTDAGADGVAGNADDEWNSTTCPQGDGSTNTAGQFTVTDYKGFVVSTTGGGVAGSALGGSCDASLLEALLPY